MFQAYQSKNLLPILRFWRFLFPPFALKQFSQVCANWCIFYRQEILERSTIVYETACPAKKDKKTREIWKRLVFIPDSQNRCFVFYDKRRRLASSAPIVHQFSPLFRRFMMLSAALECFLLWKLFLETAFFISFYLLFDGFGLFEILRLIFFLNFWSDNNLDSRDSSNILRTRKNILKSNFTNYFLNCY